MIQLSVQRYIEIKKVLFITAYTVLMANEKIICLLCGSEMQDWKKIMLVKAHP